MLANVQHIVILGGGESGVGAALLAKHKGYTVFLSDAGKISDFFKNKLSTNDIDFEEGGHTLAKILKADIIVKSPGIPDKIALFKETKKNKIKIISEIEFAFLFTKGKVIAITGTNGKTTTTLLTYHLLSKGGLNVGLAGNIGNSFAELVIKDEFDYYVIEVSSFQLDHIKSFKPYIAVITNITPDHLDRYDYKVEKYVNAKFNIIKNLTAEDRFIYGEDSELLFDKLIDIETDAQELPFSLDVNEGVAAWSDENKFYIDANFDISVDEANDEHAFNIDNCVLKGKHNLYNMMAASLVASSLNISDAIIAEGLKDFKNAEHRMEVVAQINGVTFINDSKATNVDAAWYALDAVNSPMVWIAGGVDKGNDYETIYDIATDRIKALICLGKDNQKLKDAFVGKIQVIEETDSMQQCIEKAIANSINGDTVILSPCCASFDLFKNYEDRGNQFRNVVLSYKK